MSGVMIKIGVFEIILKVGIDLARRPYAGGGALWCWRLRRGLRRARRRLCRPAESDIKRLLAYSSVENIGIILIERRHRAWSVIAHWPAGAGGARPHRGAPSRLQPFAVQGPVVLRRGRGAHRDRRTRHGASRRPHPSYAEDGICFSGRLRRDFGVAAAERLRLGMADIPGRLAQPALPRGAESWCPRSGALLALSAALAAACSSKPMA